MFTNDYIHQFPKAELHCHLDGSIRPKTLQQIARQDQLPIEDDLLVITQKMQAPTSCEHLVDYLKSFDYVLPYLQTELALETAAFDVMEQAAQDGILYIEIRFAPSLSTKKGLSITQVVEAVAKGVAKAEKAFSITGNLLISGMRNEELIDLEEHFKLALETRHTKIVGIDLAGPELDGYVPTYQQTLSVLTNDYPVQLTLHAGECGCVANVYQAIEAGAKRIGHGIALKGDVQAQRYCAEQNICIESCPTSNIQTRAIKDIHDYPLKEWLSNQVVFCLNTDNKTVSNTTLTKEYCLLKDELSLTKEEFIHLNKQAVIHSFAIDEVKEQLLHAIETFTYNKK
ncbi:adenosine deaminase [Vagococcus xieshaowenii]|uniref:adenosine deaminase n=1 Tax=Vagococcus xieshaowenii TaxID=2562451 RepID=A0A4Z0DBL3_9ENTE|nr:adenosine deaminase [Vagococcus xieshaowenii]QCA28301.1 adenosine deaminase [Vagococcus xieshaowenii]TFZ42311.1 adenosine deaminase [Vagococcus xieshaowenii]